VIIGRPQLAEATPPRGPIGELADPTVLLAPTWRGYNTRTDLSSLPYCRILAEALIRRGATVAFRPHPLSWENAAERALITEVDALLARDRGTSGRPHRLAADHRRQPLVEAFNASDALITDVGGLLVDYFATGKPYAVALSRSNPEPPETAQAAYLITADQLAAGDTDQLLDQLLITDPDAERRRSVAVHYLGDLPASTGPFETAVRALLDGELTPALFSATVSDQGSRDGETEVLVRIELPTAASGELVLPVGPIRGELHLLSDEVQPALGSSGGATGRDVSVSFSFSAEGWQAARVLKIKLGETELTIPLRSDPDAL
jgi:hypothetical protein